VVNYHIEDDMRLKKAIEGSIISRDDETGILDPQSLDFGDEHQASWQ